MQWLVGANFAKTRPIGLTIVTV